MKETWKNYREIHRKHLAGLSFSDIALEVGDTENHIADFWSRYNTFQKQQKASWYKEHKDSERDKGKKYTYSHTIPRFY